MGSLLHPRPQPSLTPLLHYAPYVSSVTVQPLLYNQASFIMIQGLSLGLPASCSTPILGLSSLPPPLPPGLSRIYPTYYAEQKTVQSSHHLRSQTFPIKPSCLLKEQSRRPQQRASLFTCPCVLSNDCHDNCAVAMPISRYYCSVSPVIFPAAGFRCV